MNPSSDSSSSVSGEDQRPRAPSPGLIRKKQRMDGERICRVCGDKAVAHNFDVITCESCKTFFRRNAHKQQKECAFGGKCDITVSTRRFCPACRLKKCFDIGMRADMILDEEERKARMEKIAENRRKRQMEAARRSVEDTKYNSNINTASDGVSGTAKPCGCNQEPCDSSKADSDALHHDTDVVKQDLPLDPNMTQQVASTSAVDDLFPDLLAGDHTEFYQHPHTAGQLHCESGYISQPQNVDGTLSQSQTEKSFEHVPPELLPSDPLMYWRLTAEEHTLLTQLTIDYKETLLKMPVTPEALTVRIEELNLDDTIGYCSHFANDMVRFIKRLPDFRALDVKDQLAALKGNAMRCLLLKSSACFCAERDAWLKDFGELPVATFARITRHEDLVQKYAAFCRRLKRILKNDFTAFALLTMLVLSEPQADNIYNRQSVNALHDKYAILLKHHLESQYSFRFATQYLDGVMACVSDTKPLAVAMTTMFSGWRSVIGPLMAEVINLT